MQQDCNVLQSKDLPLSVEYDRVYTAALNGQTSDWSLL